MIAPAPVAATAPPAALDPRLRIMLIAFKRALLLAVAAIDAYCEIGEKSVR